MRHFYQYLGQLYFQEADNWTVLSSDVDKVFESGDVKAVSLKKLFYSHVNKCTCSCIIMYWLQVEGQLPLGLLFISCTYFEHFCTLLMKPLLVFKLVPVQ